MVDMCWRVGPLPGGLPRHRFGREDPRQAGNGRRERRRQGFMGGSSEEDDMSDMTPALDEAFEQMAASFELPDGFVNHEPWPARRWPCSTAPATSTAGRAGSPRAGGASVDPVVPAGFEWRRALGDYHRDARRAPLRTHRRNDLAGGQPHRCGRPLRPRDRPLTRPGAHSGRSVSPWPPGPGRTMTRGSGFLRPCRMGDVGERTFRWRGCCPLRGAASACSS
jgi:hypothetical protein